jgi:hypothetical protein
MPLEITPREGGTHVRARGSGLSSGTGPADPMRPELCFLLAKLQKAGGRLAIFTMKPTHIELLTEARLETVFKVFHGDHDAIDSFFPDRTVKRFDVLEFVESAKLKRARDRCYDEVSDIGNPQHHSVAHCLIACRPAGANVKICALLPA